MYTLTSTWFSQRQPVTYLRIWLPSPPLVKQVLHIVLTGLVAAGCFKASWRLSLMMFDNLESPFCLSLSAELVLHAVSKVSCVLQAGVK